MDTPDQLSSIKPGDRNSISLALGLFLLLIFFLVVVSEKFLSPMQNFVSVDKNYIYGYYAFASIISFFGILFLSKLHKIGFRWFTKYTKVTRPDSSWLFIIEIITLVISLVPLFILSQIYNEAFLHTLQNGIANPSKENVFNFMGFLNTPLLIAILFIIIIIIYYIFLSVISKLILPISIGDAFKSSLLNLLICILTCAPMIAYSGWLGINIQNSLNEKKVIIENQMTKNVVAPQDKVSSQPDSNYINNRIENQHSNKSSDAIRIFGNQDFNVLIASAFSGDSGKIESIFGKYKMQPQPERGDRPVARKLNSQGLVVFNKGDYSSAANLFLQGVKADQSDPELINNYAYALLKNGQYKESVAALEKTLAIAVDRSAAWFNLYDLLAQQNADSSAVCGSLVLGLKFTKNPSNSIAYIEDQLSKETDANLANSKRQALECAKSKR